MISLTRLNHTEVVINADLIEHIESTPDTVITLTTGATFIVCEPAADVVARAVAYQRSVQKPDGPRLVPALQEVRRG